MVVFQWLLTNLHYSGCKHEKSPVQIWWLAEGWLESYVHDKSNSLRLAHGTSPV